MRTILDPGPPADQRVPGMTGMLDAHGGDHGDFSAAMSIRLCELRIGGDGNRRREFEMGRIVVTASLTLDGVMQAPGRPDEDTRGGFVHGGWAAPYSDEELAAAMGKGMAGAGGILLGRRTYEDFHGYWPHRADNPYTEILTDSPKYVASSTLTEPLPWANSTLLTGDVAEAVAELRSRPGKDLVILGSGRLIQTLAPHNLIDEYVLLIHPLVLGSGRRLFADGGGCTDLRLMDSITTRTGVMIATYRPIEKGDR
jgi:dihydrofolate reductase